MKPPQSNASTNAALVPDAPPEHAVGAPQDFQGEQARGTGASPSMSEPQSNAVVLKFGGSSVADEERLRGVAQRVAQRARTQGVVVVVSAMGKTTDRLVAAAKRLARDVPPRELDMLLSTGERESMALLAIALSDLGVDAISLTGSQCGLITDHRFGQARVMEVRPFRILDELAAGRVVIVGGFQGVSYRRDVTTLGRGGSDTSAVALAAAIGADCEIYSDVDGVYSGDPREISETQRLDEIDYESMHELARCGAKVLHARAIELAARSGIAIYARATHGGGETVVRVLPREPRGVVAVSRDANVSMMRISWEEPLATEIRQTTRWHDDQAQLPADDEISPEFGISTSPQQVETVFAPCWAMGLRSLTLRPGSLHAWWSERARDDGDSLERALTSMVAHAQDQGIRSPTLLLQRGLELVTCVGAGIEEMPEVIERARQIAAPHRPLVIQLSGRSLSFFVASGAGARLSADLHRALVQSSPP